MPTALANALSKVLAKALAKAVARPLANALANPLVKAQPARCLMLSAALAGLGALAALPASAAPLEAEYGAANGYPAGDRSNWYLPQHRVGAHTHLHDIFPSRPLPASDAPRPLPPHPKAPSDWSFVDAYLNSTPTSGLLVIKDGQVLLERYQYQRQATDRFTSWSMAKTLVGMAVGIAIGEGKINSVDDPVDRYEPALADTAWKGIAIRHVLNMASGVKFDETYDKPDTDIAVLSRAWASQQGSLLQVLGRFKDTQRPPGDRFQYISADTQVLAAVLAKATGQTLAQYVGDKIWRPMGAEADGAWVLDGAGTEAAYCCLSARLRDWGRLGLLLAEGGQRDGQAIIPADWVEAATTVRFRDFHLQTKRATPYFGYGYQTWVFPDNLGFALLGVRGQSVFVNPRMKLVMVHTAVWPTSSPPDLGRQRDGLWRDIVLRAGRL